jgi:HAE1 family hydrophobic/amphiphilic exporter-1
MGIAIVGGVISSTALSLIVVPVVYLTFESAKAWLTQRVVSWQRTPSDSEKPESMDHATSSAETV